MKNDEERVLTRLKKVRILFLCGLEEGALRLGMLGEVGVGNHAHGVAEVEFAEVVLAVCGVEIINAKGAVVVADEVGLKPDLQLLLL